MVLHDVIFLRTVLRALNEVHSSAVEKRPDKFPFFLEVDELSFSFIFTDNAVVLKNAWIFFENADICRLVSFSKDGKDYVEDEGKMPKIMVSDYLKFDIDGERRNFRDKSQKINIILHKDFPSIWKGRNLMSIAVKIQGGNFYLDFYKPPGCKKWTDYIELFHEETAEEKMIKKMKHLVLEIMNGLGNGISNNDIVKKYQGDFNAAYGFANGLPENYSTAKNFYSVAINSMIYEESLREKLHDLWFDFMVDVLEKIGGERERVELDLIQKIQAFTVKVKTTLNGLPILNAKNKEIVITEHDGEFEEIKKTGIMLWLSLEAIKKRISNSFSEGENGELWTKVFDNLWGDKHG